MSDDSLAPTSDELDTDTDPEDLSGQEVVSQLTLIAARLAELEVDTQSEFSSTGRLARLRRRLAGLNATEEKLKERAEEAEELLGRVTDLSDTADRFEDVAPGSDGEDSSRGFY